MIEFGLSIAGALLGWVAEWRMKLLALLFVLALLAGYAVGAVPYDLLWKCIWPAIAFILANFAKREYEVAKGK